ncbi:MAG: hypothetical protein U0324_24410 [Polyangiales bacterium]
MSEKRLLVHVGEVIVEAPEGADLRALEVEVRAGIAQAFAAGRAPAFAHDAPLLRATHGGVEGVGGAIARAAPPGRVP